MRDEFTPPSHTPFAHKKSLGQNFLTSPVVPGWLCDAAAVGKGDVVLEIGPGTGALTKELLARGARVVALEADARAVTYLREHFAAALEQGQLTVHHSDARHLAVSDLGLQDKDFLVVSNIPYYLSGFLLRRLLESPVQPHTLVFLMQKEMVARIARHKKESLLSLSVKAFGDPHYGKTVSRGHFNPPPKVDSAILVVKNIARTRLIDVDSEFFFTILHAGFQSKRKQLIGNLSHLYDRHMLEQIFTDLSLYFTVRAEDIDVPTWIALCRRLRSLS